MFCEKCGNPINEGAKFCRVCGNKIEVPQAVEKTAAAPQKKAVEEPAVEIKTVKVEEPAYKTPEAPVKTESKAKKPSSPARIATVCALSAPLIIILRFAINNIIPNVYSVFNGEIFKLLRVIFDLETAINIANVIDNASYGIAGLLCLIVAIGVYLLFTFKHKSKLPLFLCLIPVGEYIITQPLYDIFVYPLRSDIMNLFEFSNSLFSNFLYHSLNSALLIPFILIDAVIAYLIFRGVIKKILNNSAIAEESKTE